MIFTDLCDSHSFDIMLLEPGGSELRAYHGDHANMPDPNLVRQDHRKVGLEFLLC